MFIRAVKKPAILTYSYAYLDGGTLLRKKKMLAKSVFLLWAPLASLAPRIKGLPLIGGASPAAICTTIT